MVKKNEEFVDYRTLSTKNGRGGFKGLGPEVLDQLKIRVHKSKSGDESLHFRIGQNILEQAGLKQKDKIVVLFNDKSRTGKIVKNAKGWTLGGDSQGRFGEFGFKWIEGMFKVNEPVLAKYEVKEKGEILFSL